MHYLLTARQMRDADSAAREMGLPAALLMERAALAASWSVTDLVHDPSAEVVILCGPGNNGADGIALARILLERHISSVVFYVPGSNYSDLFELQRRILEAVGAGLNPVGGELWHAFTEAGSPDIVVDAVFGTGLSRAPEGDYKEALLAARLWKSRGAEIISLDIPSGVSADGDVFPDAVRADITVTFGEHKIGEILYPCAGYWGKVLRAEIGIPEKAVRLSDSSLYYTPDRDDLGGFIPQRNPAGSKIDFGKVLIAAGRRTMPGCAVLAAEAAFAAGAGMVRVFSGEDNRGAVLAARPEAMFTGFPDDGSGTDGMADAITRDLKKDLSWADVVVAGPGMGTDDIAAAVLYEILRSAEKKGTEDTDSGESGSPGSGFSSAARRMKGLVLDADAITLIAKRRELRELLSRHDPEVQVILTPHPGELARLAPESRGACLLQRTSAVRSLARELSCTVAAKDSRTIVLDSAASRETPLSGEIPGGLRNEPGLRAGDIFVNTLGNSGMGTAGSGDVLAGTAGALLAGWLKQEIPAEEEKYCGRFDGFCPPEDSSAGFKAAAAAVLLCAAAGDDAASALGEHAMTASDIRRCAGEILRKLKVK